MNSNNTKINFNKIKSFFKNKFNIVKNKIVNNTITNKIINTTIHETEKSIINDNNSIIIKTTMTTITTISIGNHCDIEYLHNTSDMNKLNKDNNNHDHNNIHNDNNNNNNYNNDYNNDNNNNNKKEKCDILLYNKMNEIGRAHV